MIIKRRIAHHPVPGHSAGFPNSATFNLVGTPNSACAIMPTPKRPAVIYPREWPTNKYMRKARTNVAATSTAARSTPGIRYECAPSRGLPNIFWCWQNIEKVYLARENFASRRNFP